MPPVVVADLVPVGRHQNPADPDHPVDVAVTPPHRRFSVKRIGGQYREQLGDISGGAGAVRSVADDAHTLVHLLTPRERLRRRRNRVGKGVHDLGTIRHVVLGERRRYIRAALGLPHVEVEMPGGVVARRQRYGAFGREHGHFIWVERWLVPHAPAEDGRHGVVQRCAGAGRQRHEGHGGDQAAAGSSRHKSPPRSSDEASSVQRTDCPRAPRHRIPPGLPATRRDRIRSGSPSRPRPWPPGR